MEPVYIERIQGNIHVTTQYVSGFSDAMKRIGARWSKDRYCWLIPEAYENSLRKTLETWFPGVPVIERKQEQGNDENTLESVVRKIAEDKNSLYSGDTVERLIAFSYMKGREDATRNVSDSYKRMIREMRSRAEKSRYKAIINEAIGEKDYLPFEDYSRAVTKELGGLRTELFKAEEK